MTAAAGLSYSIIIGETFSGIAKLAGACMYRHTDTCTHTRT